MNGKLHEYINKIQPASAREEIKNHIEERAEDFIKEGLSEEEAIQKAINQMGEAKSISRGLKKAHGYYVKLAIVICICICGFFLINSFLTPFISADAIGIIGGADGPTAIYVSSNFNDLFSLTIPLILLVCFIILYFAVSSRYKEKQK